MIKNLALTLMLMSTLVLISEAQIKRQYRDNSNLASVVVVKNSDDVSDIDILNSNFDLANVSMGDEIRITTEMLNAMANEPETTAEKEEIVAEVAEIEEVSVVVEVPQQAEQNNESIDEVELKTVTPVVRSEVSRANAVVAKSATGTSNKRSTASFKKKKKKKRFFLKQKRKVKKRRYNKCYAF